MRKICTADFKRMVAVEAIKEKNTAAEIATEYGAASSPVMEWKQRFINREAVLNQD